MLEFNAQDTLTFDELQQHLNIPAEELKRYVLSLCVGKYRILLKEPASKEVRSADRGAWRQKRMCTGMGTVRKTERGQEMQAESAASWPAMWPT